MNRSDFPDPATGLSLHLRLLAEDAKAASEVCAAFLPPLQDWLDATFPHAEEHTRLSAADDALMSYFKNPIRFDPARTDLGQYLRMSARGDLFNLHRAERRHSARRAGEILVEELDDQGNHSWEDGEPVHLLVADEEAASAREFLRRARQELSRAEQIALDLLLAGERRTEVFAAALGFGELPTAGQEREVKRAKDRLKKHLFRKGRPDD